MGKVKFQSEHGISTITLNRPEHYNALDFETLEQLHETLMKVKNNDDPVVIVTGEGKSFCAGGDIAMMKEIDEKTRSNFLKNYPQAYDRVNSLRKSCLER